jgi:ribosomal protein L16 Arg81 hydroxylase
VVQLSGSKTFRLHAHPARFPRMKHEPGHATRPEWLAQSAEGLLESSSLPETAERVVLHPGSVLFMPRGTYHETLAGDETAMTAVVAFCQASPAELVAKYLEKMLLQSEDWRRPLFAWSADPDHREAASARLSAMLAQLVPRIQNLSIARVLASAETAQRAQLTDETRLQRDPSTQVVLRGHDQIRVEIRLALGTGDAVTCTLPGSLRPMLEWLAEGRAPFTFADACARFADWDRTAIAAAVTALLRAKALVEIPFEAW